MRLLRPRVSFSATSLVAKMLEVSLAAKRSAARAAAKRLRKEIKALKASKAPYHAVAAAKKKLKAASAEIAECARQAAAAASSATAAAAPPPSQPLQAAKNTVSVTSDRATFCCPPPLSTFHGITNVGNSRLPVDVVRHLAEAGLTQPTPVQAQAWPLIAAGEDLVAVARTGSGKTLAFLLPLFAHILGRKSSATRRPCCQVRGQGARSPMALVLSPTRELAAQTHSVAQRFGSPLRVRSVLFTGGAKKKKQLKSAARFEGLDLIVATPGRLVDVISGPEPHIALHDVSFFVLDEADRMLHLGFGPALDAVREALPTSSKAAVLQTVLFTATWPKQVQRAAAKLLRPASTVRLHCGDSTEGKLVCAENVRQVVEIVKHSDKTMHLQNCLASIIAGDYDDGGGSATSIGLGAGHGHGVCVGLGLGAGVSAAANGGRRVPAKVICFFRTKKSCRDVASILRRGEESRAWEILEMHGDLEQSRRTRALASFRRPAEDNDVSSGVKPALLLATDVACRGLDVADISHVVQFDFPDAKASNGNGDGKSKSGGLEDYVHRIGRTGRAGRSGTAITFFASGDRRNAAGLVALLRAAKQEVPVGLLNLESAGRGGAWGKPIKLKKAKFRSESKQQPDKRKKRDRGGGAREGLPTAKRHQPQQHGGRRRR